MLNCWELLLTIVKYSENHDDNDYYDDDQD